MSGKDSKTKNSEKIKFFKIDKEGDINPVVPGEGAEGTFARIEPIFNQEPQPEEDAPSELSKAGATKEFPAIPMEPDFLVPEVQPENEPDPKTGTNQHYTEPLVPMSPAEPATELPQGNPKIEVALDLIRPQVDSIAKLSPREELTNDQIEVLRKYLALKEAEARDLRDQHRQYQTFLQKLSTQLDTLTRRNRELLESSESTRRQLDSHRAEARDQKDKHQAELVAMKNECEDRLRRAGKFDAQAEEFHKKREEWKEKVREELKRIKLKERELENKHELLKRDMQALLDSKDKHTLEIKKKNDALELEQETLEDRLRRANTVMASIDSKKRRLVETMRLAIALLEEIDRSDASASDSDDPERKAG